MKQLAALRKATSVGGSDSSAIGVPKGTGGLTEYFWFPSVDCATQTAHDDDMMSRRIYDDELHAHFVTFSCYKHRRLLDHDRAKRVVLGVLNSQLARRNARCIGFVVMPDHVYAILWFPTAGQLSVFMQQWKRLTFHQLSRLTRTAFFEYAGKISESHPFWQPKYYAFNLYSEEKLREKLTYMHGNPVRARLAHTPCDWPFSPARYYEQRRSVGVPISWIG